MMSNVSLFTFVCTALLCHGKTASSLNGFTRVQFLVQFYL